MIPEELLQQALEEYPEFNYMFNLENATNYLEHTPDGDTHDYFLYCAYYNN